MLWIVFQTGACVGFILGCFWGARARTDSTCLYCERTERGES